MDRSNNILPQPFYTRERHFAPERMAGTSAHWQNNNSVSTAFQPPALRLDDEGNKTGIPPNLGFSELLDILNPLQHIPFVNKAYRSLTGDQMSPVAKIVGGTIYGGALGGVVSIVSAAMQEHGGGNNTLLYSDQRQTHGHFND
jgi:hypothetical protein